MLKLDTKPSPDSSAPSPIDPLPKAESGNVPYEHLESLRESPYDTATYKS
jgi:hypothetical protein